MCNSMLHNSDRSVHRAAGHRYGPMPFRHNIRIGSILLPTLVVLVGFGGALSVATIMIGAMVRPLTFAHDTGNESWYACCHGMIPATVVIKIHTNFDPGCIYHGCTEVQRGGSWRDMDHPGSGKS